jgi:hypothetical protein
MVENNKACRVFSREGFEHSENVLAFQVGVADEQAIGGKLPEHNC